jgi:hypothetical protein
MKSKIFLHSFISELLVQIEALDEKDMDKLESGDFSISLKLIKKNKSNNKNISLSNEYIDEIKKKLNECKTREEGLIVLNEKIKNKKELEVFAKKMDVFFMREDKVDKIKSNIIEAIIGAKLRSNAIQGEEKHNKFVERNKKP